MLLFLHLLAVSVWVGGFVTIAVVTRVVRRQLPMPAQVAFFRSLGRGYGVVGGVALGVALLTGGALLSRRGWDEWAAVAVVLAVTLVLATGAGVAQARGMTRLRQRALREPQDAALTARIERNARRALVLRALIGALTVALLVLGAALAS
jgi:pantoate kinase